MLFPATFAQCSRRVRYYLGCVAACLLLLYAVCSGDETRSPAVFGLTVQHLGNFTQQPATFPVVGVMPGQVYMYRFDLRYQPHQSTLMRMFPHDCIGWLSINQQPVDLSALTREQQCDYAQGVTLDTKNNVQAGTNHVEAMVYNRREFYGLNVEFVTAFTTLKRVTGAALLLMLLLPLPICMGFSKNEILLWLGANILFFTWFFHTDFSTSGMDMHGHLFYLDYMTHHFLPPSPTAGWITYHPPLFYALMGWLKASIGSWFPAWGPDYYRIPCLLLFNGFLLIGMRVIAFSIQEESWRLLAYAMLLFWPSGVMIATRIDSDVLLYVWSIACFYFLLRWHQQHAQPRLLAACLFFLALAIATRSNAYVLVPVVGVVIFAHLVNNTVSLRALLCKPVILALIALIAGFGMNTGRIIYYRLHDNTQQNLIIGNEAGILGDRGLRVENRAEYFLSFNYRDYFEQPFFLNREPASDRAYFWNAFLKSSSFGEFVFSATPPARMISIIMPAIWLFALLPLLSCTRREWMEKLPHITLIFASIAGLLYNRYSIPVGPSGDFRYVYFALVPLIILFISHLRRWTQQGHRLIGAFGIGLALLLPLLTVLLYIGQV